MYSYTHRYRDWDTDRDTDIQRDTGFPCGSVGKESTCNARDAVSIPGLGRYPQEGHGNPLQCSYLKNPMDRGAWWATVHRVSKSWAQLK